MPSRWDSATRGWRRRVFHYPPPTLMSRNFRLPCAIELQPLSLTPLKMRKVELIRQRYTSLCGATTTESPTPFTLPLPFTPPAGLAINVRQQRSLRHLVVSRKVSGGTRSEQGTESKMTLASIFGTWRAQVLNPLAACRQLLVSPLL